MAIRDVGVRVGRVSLSCEESVCLSVCVIFEWVPTVCVGFIACVPVDLVRLRFASKFSASNQRRRSSDTDTLST